MEEASKTEWIDQYLDNTLNSQERTTFERRMETDVSFRQEVEAQRAVRERLLALGEKNLKEKFRQFHARMQQEQAAAPRETPVRKLWHRQEFWWAAASVALLLTAGLLWLNYQNPDQQAVSENIEQTLLLPLITGGDATMGYAGEAASPDSVVVALISSEQYPFHYHFSDTLRLYLQNISLEEQMTLHYDEQTGAYTLHLDGSNYSIDRNFNRIRALQEE